MSAYLHRYRLDTSEPTKRAVARDVAVRGLLPALGLLACVWAVGAFLFPSNGFGNEAALSRLLQAGRTPLLGATACLVVVLVLVLAASDRPRWVVVLACVLGAGWTLAVALSRFYLGMHHPSDAIAGGVIGVVCAFLGWAVLRRDTSAGA